MALYRYKAVSPSGEIGEGEMEAASREEVVARLQAMGSIPIRAAEAANHWALKLLTTDIRKPQLKAGAVAGLVQQLGALVHAGLPLDRALEILRDVSTQGDEATLAGKLLDGIQKGGSLADAMAAEPRFDRFAVSMVRAGEASGSLDVQLTRLSKFLTDADAARSKLRAALAYPIVVMVACAMSLAVLFAFVVPRFRPFFESAKAQLPFTTRALLATGDLFAAWWLPGAITVLILTLLVMVALRDPARRRWWDAVMLRIPALGDLVRKAEIGQWSEVLGTLLKHGVALEGALAIAGETLRNRALAAAAGGISSQVVEGKGLSEPLRHAGVFPPLALRLVRVGEEAARLDDMLIELGAIYARETERERERLVTLLGPALTIGMGLIVALVMGSIVTAILGVYRLAI